MQWIIAEEDQGKKLIEFLAEKFPEYSIRFLKKMIESGSCWLNGQIERFASSRLGKGDQLSFELLEKKGFQPFLEPVFKFKWPLDCVKASRMANRSRVNIKKYGPGSDLPSARALTSIQGPLQFENRLLILYEDQNIFAINKPAGIVSDGESFLHTIRKISPEAILLHRLDKDTTGVLLFAKDKGSAKELLALFKSRQMKKEYLAIVEGIPSKKSGIIENYLGKLATYQGQAFWGELLKEKGGVFAVTSWQVESIGEGVSLLRCFPLTGRTHQIRVHLSELGYPILGDAHYGRRFKNNFRPSRCLLHALSLSFPYKDEQLKIRAEPPKDFQEALNKLCLKCAF